MARLLLVVSLLMVNSALAARIIGISGASSGSHYFVVKKTMEELSSRGHEVCNYGEKYQIDFTSPYEVLRSCKQRFLLRSFSTFDPL